MLRRADLATGLPRRICLEHGTVFYENTSPSPFPTRLRVFLLALGIDVCFPRKHCPTDHAATRANASNHDASSTAEPALAGLDTRRAMLHQHIPSWVLQGRAPLQAYPQAAHSGRSYRPEWEAEMLDLDRVFGYLASCRWFRRVRANGRLDIGGYDYYLGTTWRNHMLELRFDANQGCFLGQPAGSGTTITFAPQGLTKTDLMGELGHLLALPVSQLTLPFTRVDLHWLNP